MLYIWCYNYMFLLIPTFCMSSSSHCLLDLGNPLLVFRICLYDLSLKDFVFRICL